MGIRGLMGFIERCWFLEKYEPFLEKYELHDTNLVMDGESISRHLYKIHSTFETACFEGDYDVFADYVDLFFEMLSDCQVIPYIVFEGGIKTTKSALKKVSNRFQNVKDITNNLSNENRAVYFPLFMRDVFENIAKKWKIKTVRCEFESYPAIVSIAKSLNCPVLSYNSDFFICPDGITFIPFRTLCKFVDKPYPRVCRHITRNKPDIKYIPCERFDVNRFLECLRLTADKLPLLAVMLGSDNSVYPNYKCLWPDIPKFEDRLITVALWISTRSMETAVNEILSFAETTLSKMKLQQKLESYRCFKSKYLSNLGLCNDQEFPENERDLESDCLVSEIPDIFLKNFRNCRYSPYLMDIYIHNQYYGLKTQVENFSLPHSHIWSEKIVSAIHKILTNSNTNLSCLVREGDCIDLKEISLCMVDVPSFTDIQEMDVETRKSVILKALGLDLQKDALQEIPESWQLFVITILYLQSLSSLTLPLCYSLVLCKTLLSYVDCNNYRLFCCYEDTFNYNARSKRQNILPTLQKNETGCTAKISQEMKNIMKYFRERDDVGMSLDINLLHSMSQFQSCLLHIKVLNDLLNMPFPNFLISDCFNGTFIYNFYLILEHSPDIDYFVNISLKQKFPNIITDFQTMLAEIGKTSDVLEKYN